MRHVLSTGSDKNRSSTAFISASFSGSYYFAHRKNSLCMALVIMCIGRAYQVTQQAKLKSEELVGIGVLRKWL